MDSQIAQIVKERVVKTKTSTDYDDAFVARIHGFDSKKSSICFLHDIAVPTYNLDLGENRTKRQNSFSTTMEA